jgi:hypothetical protein
MKRLVSFILLASFPGFGLNAPISARSAQGASDADQKIWAEFVSLLKDGKITERHVRPAYTPASTMLQFLDAMRGGARWTEWELTPEIYRAGSTVHFVIPLSEHGTPGTYSFTFVEQAGQWFLQHFESIVLRLDRVGQPPVSAFPDLPEDQKAWMRQENYWSQMMVLFRQMRAAAGPEAAFNMFRDGPGYLVQAKTWVPFLPPARSFILFSCWEQSRLHGNAVTLERLNDSEAVVSIDSIYLRLYRQTGHMRQLVSEDDYRRIFETIWRDRAAAAGWTVQFEYEGTRCRLRFTSPARDEPVLLADRRHRAHTSWNHVMESRHGVTRWSHVDAHRCGV